MTDLKRDLGGLKERISITIQRSNGIKHDACIQTIDEKNRTVHVEWFEGQDIKGKELSFENVFNLNPTLKPVGSKPASVSSKSESHIDNRKSICIGPRTDRPRKSGIIPSRAKKENMKPVAKDIDLSAAPPSRIASRPNQSRKSEVVKTIERIDDERKIRRENQSRIRHQRDQIRSKHDVNDAQWEFSEMITNWREDNPEVEQRHRVSDHKINVCVRKRPLNTKEVRAKETDVVTRRGEICFVHKPETKVDLSKYLDNQKYRFDYIFDQEDDNKIVYEYTAKPLVESMFDRGMATCFAYGQTGSGKTHTMGGEFKGKNQNCLGGIYALASADVFKRLQQVDYEGFELHVSFFEIYSNKVFDLLNKKTRLRVLEDKSGNIRVVNLTTEKVVTVADVIYILKEGSNCRTSGQTSANSNSSRSHAVFQLQLYNAKNPRKPVLHGMFSLIDLAGNERGADTMSADKVTRQEGADINKSLLALKECIRAMGKDAVHVPFRGSTLTKVLRDSFIGKRSRTCMIATISPGFSSCENTINTLRYADRVKSLNAEDQLKLDSVMEESLGEVESEEQSAIDMLASNNSEEFSPEMVAVTKAQQLADSAEDKMTEAFDDYAAWLTEKMANLVDLRHKALAPDGDVEKFTKEAHEVMNEFKEESTHVQDLMAKYNNANSRVTALVNQHQQASSHQKRKKY